MEQKKTLWIIAAVGLFLAVIIGTACIIYSPSVQTAPTITSISPVEKKSSDVASGWSKPAETDTSVIPEETGFVPVQTPTVSDLVVISDNTKVYTTPQYKEEGTTIDLNVLKNELAELKPESKTQNQNINITVNVSDSTSAAASIKTNETQIERRPEAPRENKSKIEKETVEPVKTVAQTSTQSAVKVEKKTPATTKPATKTVVNTAANTTTEAKKTAEPKKVTQYWIQVGAYSNKKTAEVARSALDENKISSDIFTYKDAKDNLYFRVRVGPYTTKSEAEYWRSRIIKIDEFAKAESYVVSTQN